MEVFTKGEVLELETLGPLTVVEPGRVVEHVERWYLFEGLGACDSEEQVAGEVLPRVRETS
ncbi:MAG: hypothetical protein WEB00_05750 [Dehalococcoidia bacterium]